MVSSSTQMNRVQPGRRVDAGFQEPAWVGHFPERARLGELACFTGLGEFADLQYRQQQGDRFEGDPPGGFRGVVFPEVGGDEVTPNPGQYLPGHPDRVVDEGMPLLGFLSDRITERRTAFIGRLAGIPHAAANTPAAPLVSA